MQNVKLPNKTKRFSPMKDSSSSNLSVRYILHVPTSAVDRYQLAASSVDQSTSLAKRTETQVEGGIATTLSYSIAHHPLESASSSIGSTEYYGVLSSVVRHAIDDVGEDLTAWRDANGDMERDRVGIPQERARGGEEEEEEEEEGGEEGGS
jgi:hypothetical protein